MRKLQDLLTGVELGDLPPIWTTHDLETFSRGKRLWEYQQNALQNAVKLLHRYYADEGRTTAARKADLHHWYAAHNIPLAPVVAGKAAQARLLADYFPLDRGQLAYEHLINRIGFWMATGSGKTLVIVKIIELLRTLMERGLIPVRDVLLLAHRDDLLQQFRAHVEEFNAGGSNVYIRVRDLREFAEVKRDFPSLLSGQEMTIYAYRSDNLSDEQKERIVDFRNYENGGQWYVLLDEAHKGDKDDSKRQHIYSILSREGFLFNFSATFTDDRDILTTAYEFNLASFIKSGYGKHITLLRQENRGFGKDEDYTGEEKQRVVLQSLLMLAFVAYMRQRLVEEAQDDLYHRPLLVALVNSVNTEDADLKLFFAQLDLIARGRIGPHTFELAKQALLAELYAAPELLYENQSFEADNFFNFRSLSLRDVLRLVFNAETHGEIEVLTRPSDDKELAFKLKSADAPFALVRIGNTAEWLKRFLVGYEIVQGFEDETFFERINRDDSTINLLMGSRSFYEGWDSNRPNVLTYINIGTASDAKKFILQSVGRGVRIEPLPGKRRRMLNLVDSNAVAKGTYERVQEFLPVVESLFIFGTNRAALETVLMELKQVQEKAEGKELALTVNPLAEGRTLLIPLYRPADQPLIAERKPSKFDLPEEEQAALKGYIDYLGDDRLLLAHHGLEPRRIGYIRRSMAEPGVYFNTTTGRRYGDFGVLLSSLGTHFDRCPMEPDGFKKLEDEINHFRRIRVELENVEELRRKIEAVLAYKDPEEREKVLREQYQQGILDLDGLMSGIKQAVKVSAEETFAPPYRSPLRIKNVAAHYYLPMLVSDDEKIDYINHVIKVPSEVHFVKELEAYLQQPDNLFRRFDWWMFSRTVERVDRVTIPYYDPGENRIRDFHPDFIFWLMRGQSGYGTPDYTILFVDPKGMSQSAYQYKIDGYHRLFLDERTGQPRAIRYNGMQVRVALAMYANDANLAPAKYSEYWHDDPRTILERVLAMSTQV